jgi:hypothetical protein
MEARLGRAFAMKSILFKRLIAIATVLFATMSGANASLNCRLGDVQLFQIKSDAANVVHFCIHGTCKDRVLINAAPRGSEVDWMPADVLRPGFKAGDEVSVKDLVNRRPEDFAISVSGDAFGPGLISIFGMVQCSGFLKADPRPGTDVLACVAHVKGRSVTLISIDGSSVGLSYEDSRIHLIPPLAPGITDLGRGVTAYSVNGEVTLSIDGVLTTCSQNRPKS